MNLYDMFKTFDLKMCLSYSVRGDTSSKLLDVKYMKNFDQSLEDPVTNLKRMKIDFSIGIISFHWIKDMRSILIYVNNSEKLRTPENSLSRGGSFCVRESEEYSQNCET